MSNPNPKFTATLDDCEAYFAPDRDLRSKTWLGYSQQERKASFEQAKRDIRLSIGRDLYQTTNQADTIRDDYAVFEQAIYLLQNLSRAKENRAVVDLTRSKAERAEPDVGSVAICRQAQKWLGITRFKMARG